MEGAKYGQMRNMTRLLLLAFMFFNLSGHVYADQSASENQDIISCVPGCRMPVKQTPPEVPAWCLTWTVEMPRCSRLENGAYYCQGRYGEADRSSEISLRNINDWFKSISEIVSQKTIDKNNLSIICTKIDLRLLKEGASNPDRSPDSILSYNCFPGCELTSQASWNAGVPPEQPAWCSSVFDGCNSWQRDGVTELYCDKKVYPADICMSLELEEREDR